MRRFVLHPKKKPRGRARALRALRRWVAGFDGWFPTPPPPGGWPGWYDRPPVVAALLREAWYRRAVDGAVADAAALLAAQATPGARVEVVPDPVNPEDRFGLSLDVRWDAAAAPRRPSPPRPGPT